MYPTNISFLFNIKLGITVNCPVYVIYRPAYFPFQTILLLLSIHRYQNSSSLSLLFMTFFKFMFYFTNKKLSLLYAPKPEKYVHHKFKIKCRRVYYIYQIFKHIFCGHTTLIDRNNNKKNPNQIRKAASETMTLKISTWVIPKFL